MRHRSTDIHDSSVSAARLLRACAATALLLGWALPAAAVETGDDLVFAVDGRDLITGYGDAGLVGGEIDQKNTDVRGGFAVTTADGTVVFSYQLGEPNKIKRKAAKTSVKQSADVAMWISVDDGATVDETHSARVRKCSVVATFKQVTLENQAQNLPDTAVWKVVCGKGWHKAFEDLSDEGLAVLKTVMGGGEFKRKGVGTAAHRADVLTDLVFPLSDD